MTATGQTRARILAAIAAKGGIIRSADGRGIAVDLAAELGVSYAALAQQIGRLDADGLIRRRVEGRRTYWVALADHATVDTTSTGPRRTVAVPANGRPAASPVVVRRQSIGDVIDAAKERAGLPLVTAAFDRCEDYIAGLVDEIAGLKAELIAERGIEYPAPQLAAV